MRQANSKMCLKAQLDPSGHILESLYTLFCSPICLVVSDWRIRRDSLAPPSLLNSGLTGTHCRLLVSLEMHVLLNTVDVFHTLPDQIRRISFLGRALAGTCVAKQRSSLAVPHDKDRHSITRICISTLHKAEVCTHCGHARGFAGHKWVLLHKCTGLHAMRAPRCVIDVLLQCMSVDLCPCWYRWMINSLGPRARSQEQVLWWQNYGCRDSIFTIALDIVTSTDLRRLDFQFSVSLTWLLGLIVVSIAFTIVTAVDSCTSKHSRSMLFQKSLCKCWGSHFILLLVHVRTIHRVDGGSLRAYGFAAYGTTTGRAKRSVVLLPVPT